MMPDNPAQQPGPLGSAEPAAAEIYRVLARRHRPQRLSELIGQDALVRTLGNALRTGRIAHAFLLTGIRGVGKTSTARIIARALNCIGPDGKGQPTPEPCGVCEPCVAIAESRHIDVLEMDAATRTGIDDIREIVDSVRYAPTSARYKVYIIDEVHMLSEKAFNGLLKTLEEPPPQAIFIFATTEVRKVPVTVLSRCQRFDLRRVEGPQLTRHLAGIAESEQVSIEPAALALIVRAAEGSVRDGLSLLDQAITLLGGDGAPIAVRQVEDMLGLADRGRVLDLFELVMRGAIKDALDRLGELNDLGSEPQTVVQELLGDQPLADPDQGGAGRGRGARCRRRRCRARAGDGRAALDPGAGADLADAAEGAGRAAVGALAAARRRDAAGAPRLCRRPAAAVGAGGAARAGRGCGRHAGRSARRGRCRPRSLRRTSWRRSRTRSLRRG